MQPDPHVVYQNETIVAIATPPGRGRYWHRAAFRA